MKVLLYATALAVLMCHAPVLAADTLDLAEAERLAIERDSGLDQGRAMAEADRESAVAAGALPDPELSLGLRSLPVDSFDPEDDMMSMVTLGVRQRFPGGQSRALTRERGELAGRARDAEVKVREREVRRQVRRAWTRWAYTVRQLELVREEAVGFEELVEITGRRYSIGMGDQRDLSRSRLELAAVEERILDLEEVHESARAELARWTGRLPAAIRPGQGELPTPPDAEVLMERLHDHPLLIAEARRLDATETTVDIARQSYRPDWMLEVSYGHRLATDMDGERASDLASVGVGMSVPLFTRNRQDRKVAAARAEARASHHRRMDLLHDLQGQLETQLVRYQRRRDLIDLYDDRILQEAAERLELEFSAYGADRGDFRDLIRARVDELDYRLRRLRVEQQLAESRIELDYLAGEAQ